MDAQVGHERAALLLFERLSELGPEARVTLVAAASPEVRSILTELEQADHRAVDRFRTDFVAHGAKAHQPPARIGPYRLILQIGSGGMGEVWRAERDDGLFEQVVAVKMLRRTIFSSFAITQFNEERRILARLRHPHIAQMFDGGVTDEGSPYIIMELIAAEPITDWANRHGLPLDQRLRLFREMTDAIGHAHRNLIVHADIKPSNVVVEDRFGVKLLDFGIARLIDEAPAARPTAYTPAFASPARTTGVPPTPADDIFAAGMLLRTLIEGVPRIDADLFAIASKATAADPEARYGTITELARDIERWQQHKPITAKPASGIHAVRLFSRRHRLALGLGVFGLAMVVATLAATTILWLRAEQARANADRRFTQTRAMADYMLADVDPMLAELPGTLPLRHRLVARANAYLQDLERDRGAGAELDLDVIAGYLDLARIYALDVSGGLGDLPAAQRSLARAGTLIRRAIVRYPADPRLLALRARYNLVASSEVFVAPEPGRLLHALGRLQAAQRLSAAFLRTSPGDVNARLDLWQAQVMVGRIYNYLGEAGRVRAAVEPTLPTGAMTVSTPTQRARRDFILNGAFLMLAEASENDPALAFHFYDRLVRSVGRMQSEGRSNVANDYIQSTGLAGRAQMSAYMHAYGDAVRDFRRALLALDRLLAAGPNGDVEANRALVQYRAADAYGHLGNFVEARHLMALSRRWAMRANVAEHAGAMRLLALIAAERGRIEAKAGNGAASCAAFEEAANRWAALRAANIAMAIDTGKGGPIEAAVTAAARCRNVPAKRFNRLSPDSAEATPARSASGA